LFSRRAMGHTVLRYPLGLSFNNSVGTPSATTLNTRYTNIPSAFQFCQLNWIWRITSSGMIHRVALVRTDVSEDLSTSFIRETRIGELGTTLTVTSNRRTLRWNAKCHRKSSEPFRFCFYYIERYIFIFIMKGNVISISTKFRLIQIALKNKLRGP
jgi:hypothetical protein